MRAAPLSRWLSLSLACGALLAPVRAQTVQRAAPTRPGTPVSPPPATAAPAAKRVAPPAVRKPTPASAPARGNVTLTELAAKLGLKAAWPEPGKKVVLSNGPRRATLEAGSRECEINGCRVFLGDPVIARRGQLLVSEIDYLTCLVPLLKPALIPGPPRRRPVTIALDPGHGGNDDGTENARLGLKEKVMTLDVAQRVKRRLEAEDFRVVLTRETDVRVDLPSRAIAANRAGADLFVSIHFNALPNDQKTYGTEVFTFAPQHQRSANSWGPLQDDDTEREPAPANRLDPWNALLAHALHRELLSALETFDRGKKIGHLGVLRALKCPGVLVEAGFLSHDEEARKISTPAYRQRIADALADGILDYVKQLESLKKK